MNESFFLSQFATGSQNTLNESFVNWSDPIAYLSEIEWKFGSYVLEFDWMEAYIIG